MTVNYQILVKHGAAMLRMTKPNGFVCIGLIGSGLSKRQVMGAIQEMQQISGRKMKDIRVKLESGICATVCN